MQLTFWGAARQVTGSMYLLELEDGYRILIDCGLDMEKERVPAQQNGNGNGKPGYQSVFPFEASSINLVLLTHAHIDHSGNIPNLFREGFEGKVLCTSPTYDLTYLLLMDSAMLNRKRLNSYHKKRSKKKSTPPPSNLGDMYLEKQVEEAAEQFVDVAFNQKIRIKKGVDATFIPAGHLLGAANIILEIEENGQRKSIGFSGDVGRFNYPLLLDPQPVPQVDYLLCETTYGNRRHKSVREAEEELAQIIHEACVEKPGRLIIPAFSVGRTQALLYTLNKLYVTKRLPPIKVFSDSPLALQSTRTYEKHHKFLNSEAKEFKQDYEMLFDFDNLVYVEDLKQSKAISNYREPCIIISSSGMIDGGRVQHHVSANISNPYCTILMIGYSAEGTLGYRLLHGEKTIRLGTKEAAVLATIIHTDVFSGHGDHNDLMNFVKMQSPEKLQKVFLVHGELESMSEFRNSLMQEGYRNVEIPEKGQCYQL